MQGKFYNVDLLRRIFRDGEGPKPGINAAGMGLPGLAWQLRSGSLHLVDGHVALNPSMLSSELNQMPGTLAIIQNRADLINALIDGMGLIFETLEAVQIYFDKLVYPEG